MNILIAGLRNYRTTLLGVLIVILTFLDKDDVDFSNPRTYISVALGVALFIARDSTVSSESSGVRSMSIRQKNKLNS